MYRIYLGDEVVAAPAGDAGVPDGGEQLLAVRVCHELRTTTHTAINLLLQRHSLHQANCKDVFQDITFKAQAKRWAWVHFSSPNPTQVGGVAQW